MNTREKHFRPEDFVENRQTRLTSMISGFLPEPVNEVPSATDILEVVTKSGIRIDDWSMIPVGRTDQAKWRVGIEMDWPEVGRRRYEIGLFRGERLLEWAPRHNISTGDLEAASQMPWMVSVSTELAEPTIEDFHRQLGIQAILTPETPICLDYTATSAQSGRWLQEAARCPIPPHPRNLFMLHSVGGDNDQNHWIHTHGLLRCGSIEFEIIDPPPERVEAAIDLLEAVSIQAIENGVGPPDKAFEVGPGIEVMWISWPEAARRFRGRLGARDSDRDDYHRLPSGVLVEHRASWPLRRVDPPRKALRELEKARVVSVSENETRRMERMARERLPIFRRLFERRGDEEGWEFYIKFGYSAEKDELGDSSREHLWFKLAEITEERVRCELLNEPVAVASLSKGEVGWHDVTLVSDWNVSGPEGRFDPDNIITLKEAMEGSARPEKR